MLDISPEIRSFAIPDKFRTYRLVTADRRLNHVDIAVWLALAMYFHNSATGQCNPAIETIVEVTHLKRRALLYALKRLQKFGWIERRRTSRSTQYMLAWTGVKCSTCTSDVHHMHPNRASNREGVSVRKDSDSVIGLGLGEMMG